MKNKLKNKKRHILLFEIGSVLLFVTVLMSCHNFEKQRSGNNDYSLTYDSVVFGQYLKSKRSLNKDTREYIGYYQLIKGERNYFVFQYDYLENIGKKYKYAYEIFDDASLANVYFDDVEEEIFNLKLEKKIIIEVGKNRYEIDKFSKLQGHSSHSNLSYHYICKDLGLLAVENPYFVFIVEKNSILSDRDYQVVYVKLFDIIEKGNVSDVEL